MDAKKIAPFIGFIVVILMIITGVLFMGHQEKSEVTMVEQIKAWGNVHIEKIKLANGLKVILARKKDVPTFAYYTYFDVGSRHEEKGKTGLAHFFEHLLFKETKNLKEGQFDRIMEENGASTNASTWVDWTNYYQVLPNDTKKIELVIRLEADRMHNMLINERQVTSEMGVVQNERRFRVDNDIDGKMSELLDHLAYKKHTYGNPIIGWMEDIKKYNVKDARDFYKMFYAPNNATVIIVGNFDKKKTIKLFEKYYGNIPSSKITKRVIPKEPAQFKERRKKIYRDDIDSEKAIYGYHATAYDNPDTPAIELLSEIMFNGEGSRLYKKMIIDEEIASELSAWIGHLKNPGMFQISVSMRKNQPVQKAHNRIFAEFTKVQEEGITQAELDRAKNRYEMGYYAGLGSVSGKAKALGHYEIIAGDYKAAIHLIKRYSKVSTSDVQRVARKYFSKNNRNIVMAYPKKKKKWLK